MSRSIKCADHFETSTSPSGQTPHIWPSLAKGQWGICIDLCLRRVGNLNRECQVKLVFKACLGISSGANLWFADILYSLEAWCTDRPASEWWETIHQTVGREGWENKYTETWAFTPREWWQLHDFSPVVLPGDGSLFTDLRLLFWDRQARIWQ